MIQLNMSSNICRYFPIKNSQPMTGITQLFPFILSKSFSNYFIASKIFDNARRYSVGGLSKTNVQLKKKSLKKVDTSEAIKSLTVSAFCTSEQYDMEGLLSNAFDLKYCVSNFGKDFVDPFSVAHLFELKDENTESKDAFIFREGAIVLWNFNSTEIHEILNFLKGYERNNFSSKIVKNENEFMPYVYSPESCRTALKGGQIVLSRSDYELFDKYAISNALAMSVILGAYESLLEDFIEGMLPVTEDLKRGKKIKMTKKEVLKKMGELFSLRHVISLSSDLLDTPDFYWEHEELERLYKQTFSYFNIGVRTRVMNERINHCIELVELLSSQLSDSHHIRLEWMIIALIMVEVMFEFFHYAVSYMH